ncbi:uncharacterized protein V6R79_001294 [Siganus canaliculatus]
MIDCAKSRLRCIMIGQHTCEQLDFKLVSQDFQLQPQNLTVLEGTDAQLNATVTGQYETMIWEVDGKLVVNIFRTSISASEGYNASFCVPGSTSCVQFTIYSVSREQSSVRCTVQDYGTREATLFVQEEGTVNITGGNVTVVEDQQVEFQCVTAAWYPTPAVSWTLDGAALSSDLYNTTIMTDGETNTSSVLTIRAAHSSTVECRATVAALTQPKSSSVFMVVVPTPTDWTVLIAVVVSIGGFALLVLLIIGIIFCCKRRKQRQATYEEEMSKRVRSQSEISGAKAKAERKRGEVNTGYISDGQTSVTPSELGDSDFDETQISRFEMPDVVSSNQRENYQRNARDTVDLPDMRMHRHATIV